MSRIGKQPVPIPAGVDVTVTGQIVQVKGKAGEHPPLRVHPNISVEFDGDAKEIRVTRPNDQRQNRALHGLTRSLIANMVRGVQTPYEQRLEIHGVGYNAQLAGNTIKLQVGYANTVVLPIPEGVQCEVIGNTGVTVRSIDKHACGQFAANIRAVRKPEPYKGKGIRYAGEQIRRKAGKAFAGGG
jgi:large subunit ribosomal protein L6